MAAPPASPQITHEGLAVGTAAMPRPRTPRPGRTDPPAARRVPPAVPAIASVGRLPPSGREPIGEDEERGVVGYDT